MSLGVDGVAVTFGRAIALTGVTLEVPAGQVTAVVGGDGAGKSTLLRVMAGVVPPQSGTVTSLPEAEIGYQPATSGVWGHLSVRENLAFVGASYGMSTARVRQRSTDLLEAAGLSGTEGRLGRDLSGGMRQKLGFLLAILHSPDLVLLDEPSTGVDPVSRVELWRLISQSASEGTAVLMATTYLDEAARAASVTALDEGSVIAAGSPDEIVRGLPGHLLEVTGSAPPNSWRRGERRYQWVPADNLPAGGRRVEPDLEDALIALTLAQHPEQDRPEISSPGDGPRPHRGKHVPRAVVAAGDHVTRRFGDHVAVDDVSIQVHAGEVLGLIGANGAGKTTFIRSLVGLDRPDEGSVELFGGPPVDAARRRLGYLPQGLGLSRTISVRENAEFYARVYGTGVPTLPPSLATVSDAVVGGIGLGRQRQLAFTLALAHEPELLVLDEPTSGVDPLSRARLWDVIHAQADAGRGVLVTTHYMQEASQCDRLALLSHGRLIGVGTVEELTAGVHVVSVTAPDWQRALALLAGAGLPTTLAGRTVRVAGVDLETVRAALGELDARIDTVAPTLEEAMVLRESATADRAA